MALNHFAARHFRAWHFTSLWFSEPKEYCFVKQLSVVAPPQFDVHTTTWFFTAASNGVHSDSVLSGSPPARETSLPGYDFSLSPGTASVAIPAAGRTYVAPESRVNVAMVADTSAAIVTAVETTPASAPNPPLFVTVRKIE